MMKSPVHPGEILFETVFKPLELGITESAQKLGMSRVALSRVVNRRAAISPDLAIRLETAGVSTARFWLGLQSAYDLAKAREHVQPTVERLMAAKERIT